MLAAGGSLARVRPGAPAPPYLAQARGSALAAALSGGWAGPQIHGPPAVAEADHAHHPRAAAAEGLCRRAAAEAEALCRRAEGEAEALRRRAAAEAEALRRRAEGEEAA